MPSCCVRIGGVLVQLGQLAEAEALLEQALEDARAEGDELREAQAEIGLEFVLLQTDPAGSTRQIVDLTDRVVPLFEAHGDRLGLARAWRLRSEVGRLVGHFGGSGSARDRARARESRPARSGRRRRSSSGSRPARSTARSPSPRASSLTRRCWRKRTVCAGSRRRCSATSATCSRWPTGPTRRGRTTRAAERSTRSSG